MEGENITVATANAQRGRLIREPQGLVPFNNVDVLLLSEVNSERDNLQGKLDAAGFELVSTDNLDTAIAVRKNKGFSVVSTKKFSLLKDGFIKRFFAKSRTRKLRLLGERNMLLAKLKTANGEEFDVATLHTSTPYRPFARRSQLKAMTQILGNISGNDRLVLGADFNHFPNPRRADRKARETTGLKSISMGRMRTFSRGFGGQPDDMLYRGDVEPVNTQVIDIKSDHRAIIATFVLHKSHTRSLQPLRRGDYRLVA